MRKLGEVVELDGLSYIVTSIYCDGRVVLTNIPDGMTASDFGRKFHCHRIEYDEAAGRAEAALAHVVAHGGGEMREDKLYLIRTSGDGDIYFMEVEEDELAEYSDGGWREAPVAGMQNLMEGQRNLLIKGRVVVPKPKKVVTEYVIEEED